MNCASIHWGPDSTGGEATTREQDLRKNYAIGGGGGDGLFEKGGGRSLPPGDRGKNCRKGDTWKEGARHP